MANRTMGGDTGRLREEIIERNKIEAILRRCGAIAFGVAKAGPVSEEEWQRYQQWLKSGNHAEMHYLENYPELRRDPRGLLEGSQSIICLAFSYAPEKFRDQDHGMIACYAYGKDYHDVLRKRLEVGVKEIQSEYGGEFRICIDSAPILERYWAEESGIGFKGDNGSIIVAETGSYIFLTEIITTLEIEPTAPSTSRDCGHCGACRRACPTGALLQNGEVDSRRCINYLTIEHRGAWESEESQKAMTSDIGKKAIFGCDICLRACPHNKDARPTNIEEFGITEEMLNISTEEIRELTQEEFSKKFKGSPIKRAKLIGIKRNVEFR